MQGFANNCQKRRTGGIDLTLSMRGTIWNPAPGSESDFGFCRNLDLQ